MKVNQAKCVGCQQCVEVCPVGAVEARGDGIFINLTCVECGACVRVCAAQAIVPEEQFDQAIIRCDCCPIKCAIRPGHKGACWRYRNDGGRLARVTPLHQLADVRHVIGEEPQAAITSPIVTAIGAGTTYPDCRPAPHIVQSSIDGVDVVTAVTEAPLSYSSMRVRVCAEEDIGSEAALVLCNKRVVGHVGTEEYGAKTIEVGGINLMTGPTGFGVARCMSELANKRPVRLQVKDGAVLDLQVDRPPVVNGVEATQVRIGCGSATAGLLASHLKSAADEVIVLDHHITSLFTEHEAGRYLGTMPSGVELVFRKSTPGRYFGEKGDGWGGTSIHDPRDVIRFIDMHIARPGMTILVTETTGQRAAMYRLSDNGTLVSVALTEAATYLLKAISDNCERATVAALFVGGAGGSMRAGVTTAPLRLTHAVQQRKAVITVGGAPTVVMPGVGMTFMVDVGRVKAEAFSWVPTPAIVVPIEITMKLADYIAIGGHADAIETADELRRHIRPWP